MSTTTERRFEIIPEIASTSERMVYSVQSEYNPAKRYRVDLIANGGGGKCSCSDYNIRRQPFIDAGGDSFALQAACKHVRKTRAYFLKMLLKDMAKSEEGR